MTEEKELNAVTKDLLYKTEILKNEIKNSMMHGEFNIIRGIVIFEVILKELNPAFINDEEVNKIENFTRKYLIEKEEKMQKVIPYIHYGINRCFIILESYNVMIKKRNKKVNLGFTFD